MKKERLDVVQMILELLWPTRRKTALGLGVFWLLVFILFLLCFGTQFFTVTLGNGIASIVYFSVWWGMVLDDRRSHKESSTE